MHEISEKKLIILVVAAYVFSFILILFNRGFFWDGLILHDRSMNSLYAFSREFGAPPYFANILYYFGTYQSPLFYKLVVFLSYLFSTLFFNGILKKIKEINTSYRFFILIIFSIFPVNSARIELSVFLYALCYLFFFLAFYLLSIYIERKGIVLRLISLILFFVSFATNSLLVFYLIVIAYIVYSKIKTLNQRAYLKQISYSLFIKNFDFVMIPVIYWAIKQLYFKPYGLYGDYNQISHISLRSIFNIGYGIAYSFWSSFLKVLDSSFTTGINISPSLTVFLVLLVFGIFSWLGIDFKQDPKIAKRFIILGVLIFCASVFPYVAVGKLPSLEDWDSRHQLLVSMGAAFILVYTIGLLRFSNKTKLLLMSILTVCFIINNIMTYVDFQIDSYKQTSLVENFRRNELIKNHTTFLIDDQTSELNANKRDIRFYEYSALFEEAFGNETRFADNMTFYNGKNGYDDKFYTYRYKLSQYIPREPEYIITIEKGRLNILSLDLKSFSKLVAFQLFRPEQFNIEIRDLVKINVQPIN